MATGNVWIYYDADGKHQHGYAVFADCGDIHRILQASADISYSKCGGAMIIRENGEYLVRPNTSNGGSDVVGTFKRQIAYTAAEHF